MLDLNSFYITIIMLVAVASLIFHQGTNKTILSKILAFLVFVISISIYVGLADRDRFPDIGVYVELNSSEGLISKDREPLVSLFVDMMQPIIPTYNNLSPLFTFPAFLLLITIFINPNIDLYRFSVFLAGPGFAPVFMQYRTFLGLSVFLFISAIFTSKKFRYLKYISIFTHTSLVSSLFVNNFGSKKYRTKYAMLLTTLIYSISLITTSANVFPILEGYTPLIKPTSIIFFFFCWVYILLLSRINNPSSMNEYYDKNTLTITTSYTNASYVYFMILIAIATPYVGLSTRFFAVHSSIILLLNPLSESNNKNLSQETLLFLMMMLPNILFFFFVGLQ